MLCHDTVCHDTVCHICTFLQWYEQVSLCCSSKGLRLEMQQVLENIKIRLTYLLRNVESVCDGKSTQGIIQRPFAEKWGEMVVNYKMVHPRRNWNIGTIVDALDYLEAWGVGTIINARARDCTIHSSLFPPVGKLKDDLDAAERGELVNGRPVYTEYLIRFHGWSAQWDEWVCAERISHVGAYTLNPWAFTYSFSRQWVIWLVDNVWKVEIITLKEFPKKRMYPVTDVLVRCLYSGRHAPMEHFI